MSMTWGSVCPGAPPFKSFVAANGNNAQTLADHFVSYLKVARTDFFVQAWSHLFAVSDVGMSRGCHRYSPAASTRCGPA